MSKYKIPWDQRTHPKEYRKAYNAAKKAEKQVQAAKGMASIKSVSKGPNKVRGLRNVVYSNGLQSTCC
jgi:hypothetical protein